MLPPDAPKLADSVTHTGTKAGTPPPSTPSADKPPAWRARFRRWLWRKSPYFLLFLLAFTLAAVVFWQRIVIIVGPGQAGVLFRLLSGTQIDYVYTEGLHVISPLNTMYIYEARKQLALHEFDVLTKQGLTIRLSLAIRYQPKFELLGMLHQRIGPDYLSRVVIPQAESVMRKELGQYTAEDIYTNKEGLLANAILLALDEIGRNFVLVEDIIIRSIQMPEKIKFAIEEKLTLEQVFKSYEFRMQTARKEAERLGIEANGIKEYQDIIDQSLNDRVLKHSGIEATKELAKSANAKVIVIGSGKDGLPLILNSP
jgi:prohibitin 1